MRGGLPRYQAWRERVGPGGGTSEAGNGGFQMAGQSTGGGATGDAGVGGSMSRRVELTAAPSEIYSH